MPKATSAKKEKPPFDPTPPKDAENHSYSEFKILQEADPGEEVPMVNPDGSQKTYSQYMFDKENQSKVTKEEMDEFIEQVGHSVTITQTRIEGSAPYSVASYRVEVPLLGFATWRKHTDFVWLRNHLKQKYPGMFIPYLLPKLKLTPTKSIAHRRSFLFVSFLEELGLHEILRHDEATLTFLGEKEVYEWNTFIKNASTEPVSWLGESKNISSADAENMMIDHRGALALHEKHLTKLQESVISLAAASRGVRSSVNKCSKVAQTYADKTLSEDGSGSSAIHSSVESMAGALSSWGRKSALEPAVLSDVLRPQVTFQFHQVTAFGELMSARDSAKADFEKKKKLLEHHQTAKSSGKTQTRGSRLSIVLPSNMVKQKENIDDAIANGEANLKEAEENVNYLTRCLVESEMTKFESIRTSHYKNIVGLMALGMMKVQEDVATAWESVDSQGAGITEHVKVFIPNFDNFGEQDMNDEDEEGQEDRKEEIKNPISTTAKQSPSTPQRKKATSPPQRPSIASSQLSMGDDMVDDDDDQLRGVK